MTYGGVRDVQDVINDGIRYPRYVRDFGDSDIKDGDVRDIR